MLQLRIKFNDEATTLFEYPSEASLVQEEDDAGVSGCDETDDVEATANSPRSHPLGNIQSTFKMGICLALNLKKVLLHCLLCFFCWVSTGIPPPKYLPPPVPSRVGKTPRIVAVKSKAPRPPFDLDHLLLSKISNTSSVMRRGPLPSTVGKHDGQVLMTCKLLPCDIIQRGSCVSNKHVSNSNKAKCQSAVDFCNSLPDLGDAKEITLASSNTLKTKKNLNKTENSIATNTSNITINNYEKSKKMHVADSLEDYTNKDIKIKDILYSPVYEHKLTEAVINEVKKSPVDLYSEPDRKTNESKSKLLVFHNYNPKSNEIDISNFTFGLDHFQSDQEEGKSPVESEEPVENTGLGESDDFLQKIKIVKSPEKFSTIFSLGSWESSNKTMPKLQSYRHEPITDLLDWRNKTRSIEKKRTQCVSASELGTVCCGVSPKADSKSTTFSPIYNSKPTTNKKVCNSNVVKGEVDVPKFFSLPSAIGDYTMTGIPKYQPVYGKESCSKQLLPKGGR